jgi:cbb3-type cytochrome oxidase subunit 3
MMWAWYIACFLAGIVFMMICFALSFWYVYRHKEKYATAFIHHAVSKSRANH